ncbi:MAG: hypothetical protein WCS03_19185, partial [Bacteroidota bacterium]
MNKLKFAVLIEATSIQQYIFSSNKLPENIGASFIIEKLLYGKNGLMDVILKQMFSRDFDINLWKEARDLEPDSPCEVGYIGGGNTLVFFEYEKHAKFFIKSFSTGCLLKYPSLRIAIGVKSDFNTTQYKDEYEKLLEDLKKRKARHIPNVSIAKHGITTD